MKINYIVGYTPPKMHGLLRIQDYVMDYLINKGVDLKIIAHRKPRKGFGWFNDYISYPLRIKKLAQNCINHINRPDLALCLNYLKIPNCIITCQDIQQIALPFIWNHSRFKFIFGFKGMTYADKIITVSNFSKNQIHHFLKIPKEKIIVTHNAVNRDIYKPNKKKRIKYRGHLLKDFILSVSSEQPRKNIPILLKIISKLKVDIPDILLVKIGRPDYPNSRQHTLKLIKELNLDRNILLIDYINPIKLPEFYNAASLFITTTYYEGFTLPPLEAMACGCPVVASNAASLPEALGADYPMCRPFDINCYLHQIKLILKNPSYKQDLIHIGSKRVEQFSWESTALKTLKIYEDLWAKM